MNTLTTPYLNGSFRSGVDESAYATTLDATSVAVANGVATILNRRDEVRLRIELANMNALPILVMWYDKLNMNC